MRTDDWYETAESLTKAARRAPADSEAAAEPGHYYVPIGDRSYALLSAAGSVRRCIVFVHGFAGDAAETWRDFQALSLLRDWWTASDLYFFGYPSVRDSVGRSTDDLLAFLRSIYPMPTAHLDVYPLETDADWFPADAPLGLDEPPTYDELVLAGHSLGALVLRNAVARLGKALREESIDTPLLDATLCLFAPAISGARPAGMIGALLEVSCLELVSALLHRSPSFGELMGRGDTLAQIRKRTDELAAALDRPALSAAIVWADRDDVVTDDQEYERDRVVARPKGTTHSTVCKPRRSYELPLDIVEGIW